MGLQYNNRPYRYHKLEHCLPMRARCTQSHLSWNLSVWMVISWLGRQEMLLFEGLWSSFRAKRLGSRIQRFISLNSRSNHIAGARHHGPSAIHITNTDGTFTFGQDSTARG